jgi:C4-dicarboxylate transporter, DctM subunit
MGAAGAHAHEGALGGADARCGRCSLIFLVVVGGIYTGIFTPTEGAAIGAPSAPGSLAWASGGLNRKTLLDSPSGHGQSATGMIFMIVLGAGVYNTFLALSQLPQEAGTAGWAAGLQPDQVLVAILIFYLILGCVMDSLSMILLTIPIFFPIIMALDFGLPPEELAIWFGILVLIVVEVGLITPPVGMNLFVINSMARHPAFRDQRLHPHRHPGGVPLDHAVRAAPVTPSADRHDPA